MTGINLRLNQRGQSLVQALAALGVASVVMMTALVMTDHHQRQTRLLQSKLAVLDLQRVVTTALRDGSVCDFLIANAGLAPFDPTTLNAGAAPSVLTLSSLPARGAPDARAVIVADGHASVSPLSDAVAASSILIDDLACDPRPCTGTSNVFRANLSVTLSDAARAGPVRTLKFPLVLKSEGGPNSQTLRGCRGPAALDTSVVTGGVESCGGYAGNPSCGENPLDSTATCPHDYQVTGCGYLMTKWANDGVWHSNAPDVSEQSGENGCRVWAGGAPGCGVCFKSQAFCVRIR